MGTVANLSVRIGANAQDFEKGLEPVKTSVAGMETRFKQLGAAIGAAFSFSAIAGSMEQVIESGSRIADMAERVGISAEAVQRLDFAAKQTGTSFETVATAMRVMADRIVDGKLPKALADMGLSLEQLRTMAPNEAFTTIADAIARIPDPMLQTATAVDIFGRGAQALLPAIKQGFTDVANTAPVMSNAMIASADQIGDKWAEMQLKVNNLKAQALMPLMETFLGMPGWFQTAAAGISSFMPSLEGIGLAVIAAGGPKAALLGLKEAAVTVGGWFASSFTGLFANIVPFFMETIPAAFSAVVAFLGPQGLIALGLLALAGIWYVWGDDISAFVQNIWGVIKTWLVDKWDAIKPSIQGSLDSITGFFHSAKDTVIAYAQQLFTGVKTWLVDKFVSIVQGAKEKIDAVTGFFRDMYVKVVGQSYVPDMIAAIATEFAKLGGIMVTPTQTATEGVEGLFSGLLGRLRGFVPTQFQGLFDAVTEKASTWLGGTFGQLFGGSGGGGGGAAAGGVEGMFNSLLGRLRTYVPSGFQGVFDTITGKASTWLGGITGQFGETFSRLFGGGASGDGILQGIVRNGLTLLGDALLPGMGQLLGALTPIVMEGLAALGRIFAGFFRSVWEGFQRIGGAVAGFFGFGEGSGNINEVFDAYHNLPTLITDAIASGALPVPPGWTGPTPTSPGTTSDPGFTPVDSSGTSVTVNAGTVIGNPDDLASMVLRAIEAGGDPYNTFRILASGAVT